MVLLLRTRLRSSLILQSNTFVSAPSVLELNEPSAAILPRREAQSTKVGSIGLVVLCTLIGAAAQVLMRNGAALMVDTGWAGVLSNWALIAGYICLAANTALLVLALRDGQLSVLYPIIALTYVWVTILSPMFFNDVITAYKVIGVGLIVVGVSFIGLGSRS